MSRASAMSTELRQSVYLAQTGRQTLTAVQRRRIRKKRNRLSGNES